MAPGLYAPDHTAGITRVEDLPTPLVVSRDTQLPPPRRPSAAAVAAATRPADASCTTWAASSTTGRVICSVGYSRHSCACCQRYFNADLSDLAPPGSHYTHRVISWPSAWWSRTACPTAQPRGTCGATTGSSSPSPRSRTGSRRRGKKGRATGGDRATWTGPWPISPATWRPTNCTTAPSVCCRPSMSRSNAACSTKSWTTTPPRTTSFASWRASSDQIRRAARQGLGDHHGWLAALPGSRMAVVLGTSAAPGLRVPHPQGTDQGRAAHARPHRASGWRHRPRSCRAAVRRLPPQPNGCIARPSGSSNA